MCTLWSLRCVLIILCLMSWYCFFLCRRIVSPVRGELQGYQPIYYQWFQQNTLVEYYLTSLMFYVLSPSPTPLLHPSLCVWWISYDKLVGCCAWKLEASLHAWLLRWLFLIWSISEMHQILVQLSNLGIAAKLLCPFKFTKIAFLHWNGNGNRRI